MLARLVNAVEGWCHNHEVTVAVILAAVFALLFEIFNPKSMIGRGVNLLRNKLAERSVLKLNRRIKELSGKKENLERYRTSDRALYLQVLRLLLVSVLCFGIGGFVLIVTLIVISDPANIFSQVRSFSGVPAVIIFFEQLAFQLAIMSAWSGVRISMFDSKEKLDKAIADLDFQIGVLQLKLRERIGGGSKVNSATAQ